MKATYTISTLAIAAAFLASGCGGSASTAVSPANRSYLGTQAPGDVWSWNITNGTFTATNQTKNFTYSGTESVLTTGFLKLQIQATTDPNVNVGDSAYAIELPNTALVLEPAGANTNPPITACALGSNPAGPSVSYNYVTVPSTTWTNAMAAGGYVTFNVTGNSYSGTSHDLNVGGSVINTGTAAFTCVGGRLTCTSNGVDYNGAVTPSGVIVVDYGPGNGGIIGVQQPGAAINLGTVGNMSFHGFLIKQGQTQEIEATPNGDGTLHGVGYADVETGALQSNGSGVTVTFASQPSPGLVQMDLSTSGGAEQIMAAVSVVGGKMMVLGFGAGTGSGNPPYNIMLIQE